MTGSSRTRTTLIVGLLTLCLAIVLGLTAFKTQQSSDLGQPTLGSEGAYSGEVYTPPTAFYDPPPIPAGTPNGTVLRTEKIEGAPSGVEADRILYVSEDNQGKQIAISAFYAQPSTPPVNSTRYPLVAVAHGTTGVSAGCGMSTGPFTPHSTGAEYWGFIINSMVNAGYAVVATDYEGMGAPGKTPYLMRKQAKDVLDSIRATLHFKSGVVNPQEIALWGHSEGAYVTLTTADQAAQYAPELTIRGAVNVAPGYIPPMKASSTILTTQTADQKASPRSGYITTLSTSWLMNYPDLFKPSDFYTPVGEKMVPEAAKVCQGAMLKALPDTFGTYFQASLPASFTKVAAENLPITTKTSIPLLFVQGMKDTGIVPQATWALAQESCNLRSTVQMLDYPNDTHRSSAYTSQPQVFDWLGARMSGQPATNQCKELG